MNRYVVVVLLFSSRHFLHSLVPPGHWLGVAREGRAAAAVPKRIGTIDSNHWKEFCSGCELENLLLDEMIKIH
jgi:hypothetical protein